MKACNKIHIFLDFIKKKSISCLLLEDWQRTCIRYRTLCGRGTAAGKQ